jgi:hypothetical protein
MLNQQMTRPNLATVRITIQGIRSDFWCRVVLGHVGLELLGVGSWRGFPS